MNKVNIITASKLDVEPSVGSIWKDIGGSLYIFAAVSSKEYAAICLNDGIMWRNSSCDKNFAVGHLTFVAAQAGITVTPKI